MLGCFGHVMKFCLFVTPPSTHAENIGCLGLAFLDQIYTVNVGMRPICLYRSDVKLLYLLPSESVILCGRILSK